MRAIDDTSSVVGEFDVFRESWWGGERNSRESWKEMRTTTESWKYLNDREWNFWFCREIRTKYIFTKMCVYIYLTNCTYLNYSEGEETYARTSSSVEKNICQMENDDKTGITHRELKKIKETRVKRRRNVE